MNLTNFLQENFQELFKKWNNAKRNGHEDPESINDFSPFNQILVRISMRSQYFFSKRDSSNMLILS